MVNGTAVEVCNISETGLAKEFCIELYVGMAFNNSIDHIVH